MRAGNYPNTLELCLALVLFCGCATSDVNPIFPTSDRVARPDRILVYDFAVTPSEIDMVYGTETQSAGRVQSQPKGDIEVGRAFAKAQTRYLVEELRSKGIEAYPGSESTPAKENSDTASVRGRFLRMSSSNQGTITGFDFADGQLRTKVQIWQGGGMGTTVVAEAETTTNTSMNAGPAQQIPSAAIEADAKRSAAQIAERIVDYYKRRGWIQ